MNFLKKTSNLLICALVLFFNQSCNQKSEYSDETLKSFMLAGVYGIQSYGGFQQIKSSISGATKEDIINNYKNILVLYFDSSYTEMCSATLAEYWNITDRESLLLNLEDLKSSDYPFKAWDYSRLANNATLGYCSGFMTKEEVFKILEETLVLAKSKYSTWEEYHSDFNLGRKEWNPNSPDSDEFTKLIIDMSEGDNSIYNLIPLN